MMSHPSLVYMIENENIFGGLKSEKPKCNSPNELRSKLISGGLQNLEEKNMPNQMSMIQLAWAHNLKHTCTNHKNLYELKKNYILRV